MIALIALIASRQVRLAGIAATLRESRAATGTEFPRLADVKAAAAYQVSVTNTGSIDADDVVLGFVAPPAAGTGGLPRSSLFGFERVHVKAGATVSVWLQPSELHLAPVGTDGVRRPLAGRYEVTFGLAETRAMGMGYARSSLRAVF